MFFNQQIGCLSQHLETEIFYLADCVFSFVCLVWLASIRYYNIIITIIVVGFRFA